MNFNKIEKMTVFKQLKDVSNNFEQQLRTVSTELFSTKIGESFEEGITKKLQDLTFLTSKLRLVQAKTLSGKSLKYISFTLVLFLV